MSKIDDVLKKITPHTVTIWAAIMITVLAGSLGLKGRFIGLGVGVGIGIIRWILPHVDGLRRLRSNYQLSNGVQVTIGLVVPCILVWGIFYGLNFLPWIGDVAFRNYKGLMVLSIAFLGLGFLVLNETDRPNKYMLPLIGISGVSFIAFGISTVDYDYLLIVLLLLMGVIVLWDWWFSPHLYMKGMARSAMVLVLPIAVFTCGQIASQVVLRILFPSGLLIQYFFALPGLFVGVFLAIYLTKFNFRKSSWIVAPLVPIILSLILGIEAGMCYWLSFGFTLFLMSLVESHKVFLLSGISLATTVVLYLLLPGMHIPFNLIGTDLRSALGVSVVVFWLIITLFGNQVRRDWSLEHLAKIRFKNRRSKIRR